MDSRKLSDINYHPRDKNITFTEEGHIYTLSFSKEKPVSTTETIGKYHEHFNAEKTLDRMFKDGVYTGTNPLYIGKTREEVKLGWETKGKNASEKGTFNHQDIENFFNGDIVENPNGKEHQMFLDFWRDYREQHPTHHEYRVEWVIYDDNPNCKKVLAGSIDFVVEDEEGNIYIYDWKFIQELKKDNKYDNKDGLTIHKRMYKPFNDLDDCNYNHYRLQLNFYRYVLENLYGKNVKRMALIKLHSDQEKYELHDIERYDLSKIWHTLR